VEVSRRSFQANSVGLLQFLHSGGLLSHLPSEHVDKELPAVLTAALDRIGRGALCLEAIAFMMWTLM